MAKRSQHNAWNEVYALILLGTGTLLFLALISYVPKDIPTWFPLLNSTSSPNRPAQNFLGPLGAVVRGHLLFSDRRRVLSARRDAARFRRREAFSRRVESEPPHRLDRALHRLGRLPAPFATVVSARLAARLQNPGAGRLGRLFFWPAHLSLCDGQRLGHRPRRHLPNEPDPDDRAAADSSR